MAFAECVHHCKLLYSVVVVVVLDRKNVTAAAVHFIVSCVTSAALLLPLASDGESLFPHAAAAAAAAAAAVHAPTRRVQQRGPSTLLTSVRSQPSELSECLQGSAWTDGRSGALESKPSLMNKTKRIAAAFGSIKQIYLDVAKGKKHRRRVAKRSIRPGRPAAACTPPTPPTPPPNTRTKATDIMPACIYSYIYIYARNLGVMIVMPSSEIEPDLIHSFVCSGQMDSDKSIWPKVNSLSMSFVSFRGASAIETYSFDFGSWKVQRVSERFIYIYIRAKQVSK